MRRRNSDLVLLVLLVISILSPINSQALNENHWPVSQGDVIRYIYHYEREINYDGKVFLAIKTIQENGVIEYSTETEPDSTSEWYLESRQYHIGNLTTTSSTLNNLSLQFRNLVLQNHCTCFEERA